MLLASCVNLVHAIGLMLVQAITISLRSIVLIPVVADVLTFHLTEQLQANEVRLLYRVLAFSMDNKNTHLNAPFTLILMKAK